MNSVLNFIALIFVGCFPILLFFFLITLLNTKLSFTNSDDYLNVIHTLKKKNSN